MHNHLREPVRAAADSVKGSVVDAAHAVKDDTKTAAEEVRDDATRAGTEITRWIVWAGMAARPEAVPPQAGQGLW